MTELEKTLRDIKTRIESINLDNIEIAAERWNTATRNHILQHIAHCIAELENLKNRLPFDH